jgi:hypothetical protein
MREDPRDKEARRAQKRKNMRVAGGLMKPAVKILLRRESVVKGAPR